MQQRCTSAAGNNREPQLGQEPNSFKLQPAHRPSAEQVHCFLLLIHIRTRHTLCADARPSGSLAGGWQQEQPFHKTCCLTADGQQTSSHHLSVPATCRVAPVALLRRQLARQTLHRVSRRRSSRGSSSNTQRGAAAGGPRAATALAPRPLSLARPTSLAPWLQNGVPSAMPPFGMMQSIVRERNCTPASWNPTRLPQPFRCLCSAVLVHDNSRAWIQRLCEPRTGGMPGAPWRRCTQ
jgi:hypothetical protein